MFEFVFHIQDEYSVFWFSAESSLALQEGFDRAAYKLNPESYNTYLRSYETDVREWLQEKAHGKWVLVLDDASPDMDFTRRIPQVEWGKTIVISRNASMNKGLAVAVELDPLSPTEAARLLLIEMQ